jgi:uncharacterized damage-inducible protein DinB
LFYLPTLAILNNTIMTLAQTFLAEVQHESANTRKLLAVIPFDKADFKPHEKSMTLKRLAIHVTETTGWWKECLTQDELDFAKDSGEKKDFNTTEELLAYHDTLVANAEKILSNTPDEEFFKPWTMRSGEQVFFTMPKAAVVRTWCLNHLFHHRGQLTVYLRLLDVPLPGMYGPTADNEGM